MPPPAAQEPPRLLVASSRAPNLSLVVDTKLPNVTLVTYKYDTCTLNDILGEVQQELGGTKASSIALLMHCSETEIFICFTGSKALNLERVKTDLNIREFFRRLVSNALNHQAPERRMDFLGASNALQMDGPIISRELEHLLNIPVGMTKDLLGEEVQVMHSQRGSSSLTLGKLYFQVERLSESLQAGNSGGDHRLNGYEKIRTVGKGAFGMALLYRKVADDSLVVIKEVNMIDLSATERQMALNEAQVLSLLDHPNIVSYHDSFEKDGVLMIEMEYADGGTLGQMLQRRATRLSEREILLLFRQIVAAIRYMHDNNILHRDLKTANVFLNKDGTVKVGDFGISKMMTTRGQANTVLGTPYYISPEMCEGKEYGQKSDIWALGCILYEMACLQKAFEGSNLPALVNKIMKGHFQPIPGEYSSGFRQLVHDLLQHDPMFRPSAAVILETRLPRLLDALIQDDGGEWFLDHDVTMSNVHNPTGRSVLYDLKTYETAVALTPIQLPPRSKVKEVACSNTHIIVLTAEMLVYTWGEGKKGQLAHGEAEPWRQHPECVEMLRGKSINKIGAGDGYSVFVSDSGMMMTCGDGTFGCLGHGDWNNSVRPKLVEKLLSVDVAVVACGAHHVAVLSGGGEMYTWGRGDGGRLGLGNEEDCCLPMMVPLPSDCVFRTVRCGGDGTAAITTEGAMLVCGRNTCNKLGLGDRSLRLLSMSMKQGTEMDKALSFTRVKVLGTKVADVSLGPTHTAVLTESGHVITFGRNTEGQLGRGHYRAVGSSPAIVKSMADKVATVVRCGPTYTVVGTIENAVYFWGLRYGRSFNEQDMNSLVMSYSETGAWTQSRKSLDPTLQTSKTSLQYSNLLNTANLHSNHLTEVVVQPQEILALYASPTQISKGHTVSLAGLFPLQYSVLVLVDTTVPLARLQPLSTLPSTKVDSQHSEKNSTSEEEISKNHLGSPEEPEFDSIGPVPEWIKQELAQADKIWKGDMSTQKGHH